MGREVGELLGPHAAPQLRVGGGAQGSGPAEVVGDCREEPHKVDPCNGGDLLGPQEGVHPVPRLGRWEGGAQHGLSPVLVRGGGPEDPLRVPAGRDDREEQGGARALFFFLLCKKKRSARALLLEDLSPVVGAPRPGKGGGGQVWVGLAARRMGGWREGRAPGKASPGAVYRVGQAGAGGLPARAFHKYPDVSHFAVLVRRVQEVKRRVQLGHPSRLHGPNMVQVLGRVHGRARPEGAQQGWGADVEGGARPFARQPQAVRYGQERAPLC